jgi:hypothetical protein
MATIGTILTPLKLSNMFDRYAETVLRDYMEQQERKKGERRKYKITKELPTKEEYAKLRTGRFTTTIGDLLTDAFSEFDNLKDELQDWYDNLPEAFQTGDKGQQLEEAISNLDNISEVEAPQDTEKLSLVHMPILNVSSRADRHSEAVSMLQTIVAWIEELEEDTYDKDIHDDLDQLKQDLEEQLSNAENVDYPGMY